jgi:hypothetical protein
MKDKYQAVGGIVRVYREYIELFVLYVITPLDFDVFHYSLRGDIKEIYNCRKKINESNEKYTK